MRIRVEVKNEILGDSVFWEGDEAHVNEIRNIVGKKLAQAVVKDGISRKSGMWIVSVVSDD